MSTTTIYWVSCNHRRSGPFTSRERAELCAIELAKTLNPQRYEYIDITEEEVNDD